MAECFKSRFGCRQATVGGFVSGNEGSCNVTFQRLIAWVTDGAHIYMYYLSGKIYFRKQRTKKR